MAQWWIKSWRARDDHGGRAGWMRMGFKLELGRIRPFLGRGMCVVQGEEAGFQMLIKQVQHVAGCLIASSDPRNHFSESGRTAN
jgi:hypothetical protein